jgi:hypothetical protein
VTVEHESARDRWTAGADAVHPHPAGRGFGEVPSGRMHAVSDAGLIAGRALCLAPVQLLDPAVWRWPDDADETWPLCWTCLALTHLEGHDPWPTC